MQVDRIHILRIGDDGIGFQPGGLLPGVQGKTGILIIGKNSIRAVKYIVGRKDLSRIHGLYKPDSDPAIGFFENIIVALKSCHISQL